MLLLVNGCSLSLQKSHKKLLAPWGSETLAFPFRLALATNKTQYLQLGKCIWLLPSSRLPNIWGWMFSLLLLKSWNLALMNRSIFFLWIYKGILFIWHHSQKIWMVPHRALKLLIDDLSITLRCIIRIVNNYRSHYLSFFSFGFEVYLENDMNSIRTVWSHLTQKFGYRCLW